MPPSTQAHQCRIVPAGVGYLDELVQTVCARRTKVAQASSSAAPRTTGRARALTAAQPKLDRSAPEDSEPTAMKPKIKDLCGDRQRDHAANAARILPHRTGWHRPGAESDRGAQGWTRPGQLYARIRFRRIIFRSPLGTIAEAMSFSDRVAAFLNTGGASKYRVNLGPKGILFSGNKKMKFCFVDAWLAFVLPDFSFSQRKSNALGILRNNNY